MNAIEAYLLARAYTNQALEGAGALKGAACQIKSITSITGGHRVTFEWEDDEGESSTETMDVMDGTNGTDGDDGVGIASITYKETDVSGNYVYTVLLTDSSSYDITCPKGPQGSTGQTGATGNGIVSIEKTSTVGLVDTYTITYTNGQTTTFTVTNGESITVDSAMSGSSTNPVQNKVITEALADKQNAITAGDDLKFSGSTLNVEVSVPYIDEYDLSTDGNGWTVITKKHKGEVVSTDVYPSGIYTTYNIDDCFTLQYGGSPAWIIELTKASTIAPAGTVYGWEYGQTPAVSNIQFELAETGTASEFIIDLNEALAGKQDTLTFDNTPTENSTNPVKSGGIYSALAGKTDTGIVADDFDSTASYVIGNYCIKDGKLYRFKANHSGAWAAADVDEIQITGELATLKSGLNNKQDTILQTGLFNTATGSIETGISMQKFISAYSANWDNAYCYVRRKSSDNTAIIDVKDANGNAITNTAMAVIVNYLP